MATLPTQNPYVGAYGENYINTLNAIAAATDPNDFNEFVNIIINSVNSTYYGSSLNTNQLAEFKTLPPLALGAYIGGEASNMAAYNMIQRDYITLLTQSIYNIPVESIPNRINDVQDNVYRSGLSSAEQGPILFGVMIGITTYEYWRDKVATPGDWEDALNDNAPYQAAQYMLIPYWVSAAIEGALYGANIAANNHTEGYADNPGISKWAITAFITAIATAAGKVKYRAIPRIQNNCGI